MNNKEWAKIRSDLIEHQVNLTRYSKRLSKNMAKRFQSQIDLTAEKLAKAIKDYKSQAQNSLKTGKASKELDKVIDINLQTPFLADTKKYKKEIRELIDAEEKIYKKLISPSDQSIFHSLASVKKNAIVEYVPIAGRTIDEWFDNVYQSNKTKITTIIKNGVHQGMTIDEMQDQIIGTKLAGYRDGVAGASVKQIETVVRSTALGVTNETHRLINETNADIITGEVFTATLDSSTTLTCASFDGQKFKIGEGPLPPLHLNCRSIRIPFFEGVNIETGERASDDGAVSASISFDEFLNSKTVEWQNEFLGKEKAKLFREHKLQLKDLVDKSGREYTLEELMKKYKLK